MESQALSPRNDAEKVERVDEVMRDEPVQRVLPTKRHSIWLGLSTSDLSPSTLWGAASLLRDLQNKMRGQAVSAVGHGTEASADVALDGTGVMSLSAKEEKGKVDRRKWITESAEAKRRNFLGTVAH